MMILFNYLNINFKKLFNRSNIIHGTLFLIIMHPGICESILRDPKIPHNERTTYSETVGDKKTFSSSQVKIKYDGQKQLYEITDYSPNSEVTLTILSDNLTTKNINEITTNKGFRIATTTAITGTGNRREKEIESLAIRDLAHILRGFPFDLKDTIPINFVSSESDDSSFSLGIRNVAKETLKIKSRSIKTYKLELIASAPGIMGMFIGMAPKTFFWYSVNQPHYLVKYEGSSGGPGSPIRTLQITNYSGW